MLFTLNDEVTNSIRPNMEHAQFLYTFAFLFGEVGDLVRQKASTMGTCSRIGQGVSSPGDPVHLGLTYDSPSQVADKMVESQESTIDVTFQHVKGQGWELDL